MNNNYVTSKMVGYLLPLLICFFTIKSWSQTNISIETTLVEYNDFETLFSFENNDFHEFIKTQQEDIPFELALNLPDGVKLELNLKSYNIFRNDLLAVNQFGQALDLIPAITLKGSLKAEPNTEVRVTLTNSNFHLKVYNEEGITIEKISGSKSSSQQVYSISKNIEKKKPLGEYPKCKGLHVQNNESPSGIINNIIQRKNRSRKKMMYCLNLAAVADVQCQELAGDESTFLTDFQIVLNVVNGYYKTFDVEFKALPIVFIEGSTNPWTDVPSDYVKNHTNFSNWAKANLTDKVGQPHNVGALFTGQDFKGINYAYLDQMCPGSVGHTQLTYRYFKNENNMAWFGNLVTHEIGHIWSAEHITQDNKKIMSPSIYGGTLSWSSATNDVITSSVTKYDQRKCLPKCDIIDGNLEIDLDNNSIQIFPIPASDALNIHLSSSNTASYKISSVEGKLLKKGNLNSSFSVVNVEALPKGMYFIDIKTKTPSLQQKVELLIIE